LLSFSAVYFTLDLENLRVHEEYLSCSAMVIELLLFISYFVDELW
jgi:hypothetical protein